MSRQTIFFFAVISITVFGSFNTIPSYAGAPWASKEASTALDLGYKPAELIVRFAPKANGMEPSKAEKNEILSFLGEATVKRNLGSVPGLSLVKLPAGVTVEEAATKLNKTQGIMYAEPNYYLMLCSGQRFPNDPLFYALWGMHNTGQYMCARGPGTPDADIDAPEAWDIETDASDIIVAVIDSGVDYTHKDLADNMWINEAEFYGETGVDDDGNGYKDDIYGYDFSTYGGKERDSDPMDDLGHGTHVSGTLGAVGNNGLGVVGVCWRVRIMALKIVSYDAQQDNWRANLDDAVDAISYAVLMGAKVTSNSWGGYSYYQSLRNEIENANVNGRLFVAAAGNDDKNIDVYRFYPASYDLDNIISVMATDNFDVRSEWPWLPPQYQPAASNWGAVSVDLAAPGTCIYSCVPSDEYWVGDGTSMATPHVSGACALVWAVNASLSHLEVKAIILSTVDELEALDCVTEGRLNVHRAVDAASHYARAFCVKNISDERVAWFDDLGNLFLKGSKQTTWQPPGQADEFIIEKNSGPTVYIDDSGNLFLKGGFTQGSQPSATGADEFRVQNSEGQDVAIIKAAEGNVHIKGKLYEQSP